MSNRIKIEQQHFLEAWSHLQRSGSNAAGVDGVRISDVEDDPFTFIESVSNKLSNGLYVPSDVKNLYIERNGKSRVVGILTLEDRLIHLAIKDHIEPCCIHKFHPNSYAYQPGKSATKAADRIEKWVKEGYEWIGESDIRSFFDEINHEILRDRLEAFINDTHLASFIIYLFKHKNRGILQGSQFHQ
ncbi:hypothetical protein EJF36_06575 [Bacillus sp. HMF5848]|uniref:reverse transcriptase domain-containing protein n=1 Tax=Bacillus sp. HMF5848 TaxID=2495421 RepID=UPI000F784383|nr:reverse transcriptase domain-containing protein [Bacillus sp. HMF5848]RSK26550.1 hypothetical protein EJF36_06575 [Bacillus sp. HMF5848]